MNLDDVSSTTARGTRGARRVFLQRLEKEDPLAARRGARLGDEGHRLLGWDEAPIVMG